MLPRGSSDGAGATSVTTPLSGRRRTGIWALIVLASVLALVAIVATWVNRQLLDNHNWQNASTQLVQDPAIQSALSAYLVDQVYTNVDVPAALAERLPPTLKPLAVPVAAALRQPAARGFQTLLTRPRVQNLWITASTVSHQKLVNVLENKTGSGISTGSGDVTIDLGALIRRVGPDVGLPAAALSRVPANAGVITIMRSDQLGAAQTAVRVIRVVSVWLLVLVLLMLGAALYLARGERRETLRNIGWAIMIVGIVVLVVRRTGGNYVVDALASPPYRHPARHAWQIGSTVLRDIGLAGVLYGVVIVLGAVLAGPTRAATAVRGWLAPVLNEKPLVAWSLVAFAYLLLVLWGGTHALRTWQGILLLGALLAVGVAALRRETLAEFPKQGSGPTPSAAAPKDLALS
jgi:hypothetical protein